MACQPAINIDLFLVVAFQAHAHLPVFGRQAVHIFNLSVAFLTGDFFVNMALMVEQNVFRHVVYLDPGR